MKYSKIKVFCFPLLYISIHNKKNGHRCLKPLYLLAEMAFWLGGNPLLFI